DDVAGHRLDAGIQLGLVGNREVTRAAYHDRLKVLGAHHRAQPGATGRAPVDAVVLDRGEAHQPLAGRADAGHARLEAAAPGLANFLQEAFGGLERVLAPHVGGVAELDLAVVDPDVRRSFGLAAHHQQVVAGALQVHRPVAAALGLAEHAGQGRAGTDAEAVRERHGGTGERPAAEHHGVLRAK